MMMNVSVNVESHVEEALEELASKKLVALEEIGLVAEGYAKQYCPVDTGRLRNSISHAVDEGEDMAIIGTNVEYAAYVELGTSRMTAQPYLEPAAVQHTAEYEEIVKSHFTD